MASQTADTQETDVSLVARMAAGEQEALSDLYDRYRGVVFALALRVLRDRAEAEEVLTDVFLQAWRAAAAFDRARASVPGWLVMLCRSRAIDRARSRGRREAAIACLVKEAHEAHGAEGAHGAQDPAAHVEAMTKRRRISAALGRLTPQQRSAIELAYYGGMSHSEIAEKLGEPLGTVKTRIRQGLMTLRDDLGRGFDAM